MSEHLPAKPTIEEEQSETKPASRTDMLQYLKWTESELRSSTSYHVGSIQAIDESPYHEAGILGATGNKVRELTPGELEGKSRHEKHAQEYARFLMASEELARQIDYIPHGASDAQRKNFSSDIIDAQVLTMYANALTKKAGEFWEKEGRETDKGIAHDKARALDAAAELAISLAENYSTVMTDIDRIRENRPHTSVR
ncbi:MAG: hypothetical protein WBP12_00555 [Candidatus Saccharimonas sp.]